ncbi:P-loop containing nucleoside triphosphate hydrolase protein [Rickenella mellea]|uniref:RNA helicase n=1 Tax=Rickenella mellea TaxID=50990 RepID=A0A4Y7QNS2_9AGAM|nr:P-loop containing nucleoside triphosphate hydrolase protein [Rickenella mellea]
MEAFQLLCRGGARFDKQRFKENLALFDSKKTASHRAEKSVSENAELPTELDFFKYAKGGSGKRKAVEIEDEELETEVQRKPELDHDSNDNAPEKKRQRVTTKGSDVPPPIVSFNDLQERFNLPKRLLSNLSSNNYVNPTGIQAHAVPILLEGRDLAAISPTGTGKTLSYLLPVMSSLGVPMSNSKHDGSDGVRAVILAPTRELAHQIHNECLKLAEGRKWRIVLFSKATAATLAVKSVRDKIDIIISTPLRLVASLQDGKLVLNNVRHLVLDEADRLLDSEFISQTEEVIAACTHPELQKCVFSATLPAGAEKIAMSLLMDPIRVVVGLKDTPLPLIVQSLRYVADESSKLPTLLTYLSQPYNPPILVFTSTQPRASSLAEQLILNSVPNVDCLHAGMTKKEREDAVSRMRKGESWVMISTEVMARGMDFKGIRGVINYDFPTSVQSYVHRIGRTGRAGREGLAITYFTNEDASYLKAIANVLSQSGSTVPEWMLKLPKPSKLKRRQMGKVNRGDAVSKAGNIGRSLAIKRKDMVAGSKRRKAKDKDE